ncbi:MAG: ABC transporter ATP-binding protein [Gemmataceae bacterium]
MLNMKKVTKHYRLRQQTVTALGDASLEIPRGDFVSIVGPSGSGKSTLLLLLGGMLAPSSGQILVDGQSIYDLPVKSRTAWRRRKIGFVFQSFHLVPYLTALENVEVPLYLAGVKKSKQRTRAAALLEGVGLADRLEHKPSELSVGQQQRVALARTLANDPELILADEPTGNLDPERREQVFSFLVGLHREGKTIVLVTHDPLIAARCRRVVRLDSGKIVEQSTAADNAA